MAEWKLTLDFEPAIGEKAGLSFRLGASNRLTVSFRGKSESSDLLEDDAIQLLDLGEESLKATGMELKRNDQLVVFDGTELRVFISDGVSRRAALHVDSRHWHSGWASDPRLRLIRTAIKIACRMASVLHGENNTVCFYLRYAKQTWSRLQQFRAESFHPNSPAGNGTSLIVEIQPTFHPWVTLEYVLLPDAILLIKTARLTCEEELSDPSKMVYGFVESGMPGEVCALPKADCEGLESMCRSAIASGISGYIGDPDLRGRDGVSYETQIKLADGKLVRFWNDDLRGFQLGENAGIELIRLAVDTASRVAKGTQVGTLITTLIETYEVDE